MRRLARQRKARTDEAAFVIDGPTLLDEALAAGVQIQDVVAEPEVSPALLDRVARTGATVHQAAAGTLAKVSDTVTPQPVAAVGSIPHVTLPKVLESNDAPFTLLVLVGVNDPGNAGTLLRSAEAAGFRAAIFCDDSTDPYGPKCVRSAAGSLFRLPVVRSEDGVGTLKHLRDRSWYRVGAVAQGGERYDKVYLVGLVEIVLGSEAHGLSEPIVQQLDQLVTIPMEGPVESLNVAMAGTLLCFEVPRQEQAMVEPSVKKLLDSLPGEHEGFSEA
jgi:TrmH family RNA methyltransferase